MYEDSNETVHYKCFHYRSVKTHLKMCHILLVTGGGSLTHGIICLGLTTVLSITF